MNDIHLNQPIQMSLYYGQHLYSFCRIALITQITHRRTRCLCVVTIVQTMLLILPYALLRTL